MKQWGLFFAFIYAACSWGDTETRLLEREIQELLIDQPSELLADENTTDPLSAAASGFSDRTSSIPICLQPLVAMMALKAVTMFEWWHMMTTAVCAWLRNAHEYCKKKRSGA